MSQKAEIVFLRSAAGLILAAALERLSCLFHGTLASRMLLAGRDGFFGFQVRDELWVLAVMELAVGLALFCIKDVVFRLWLLAWAITNYFVIRGALSFEGVELATSFIGSLSDPFHLSRGWSGRAVWLIPYYLLAGAYLSLAWRGWRAFQESRRNRARLQTGKGGFWKISCPACGGRVQFPLTSEGWDIPCPHCTQPMKLRREEELKASCYFCQGHIQFPVHALGRRIACPHCRGEITLRGQDTPVTASESKAPEARPAEACGILRNPGSKSSSASALLGALFLINGTWLMSEEILDIRGHYEVLEYGAKSPVPLIRMRADFKVLLAPSGWQITATNSDRAGEWALLAFDGTNTFALMPYEGHFVGKAPGGSRHFATVSTGPLYETSVTDYLHLHVLWLAFAAGQVAKADSGVGTMPLPWAYPRKNVSAYGYRWHFTFSPDGMFVTKCEARRDPALDLPLEEELLRPTLSYPRSPAAYQRQADLRAIRSVVPAGFVNAAYSTTSMRSMGQWNIPAEGTFVHSNYNNGRPFKRSEATLKVTEVATVSAPDTTVPDLTEKTLTRDFRYRQQKENRIYEGAVYVQGPGDWRSATDPLLLKEADAYLAHGPKFGDYGLLASFKDPRTGWKRMLLYGTFVALQVLFVTLLWRGIRNRRGLADQEGTHTYEGLTL